MSTDPVATFLLAVAGIFVIGAVGELIFERTSIPDVIWLILAGILLGPVGGLVTKPQLNQIAPYFAALTLVVVLFNGGSSLRLGEVSTAAPRSSLLALLGFVFSALAVALISKLAAAVGLVPAGWTWAHGLMLGCILGGSSSIIIMPAVEKARLDSHLANLINLESALTDALCVVGTSAFIEVLVHGTGGAAAPLLALLRSFGIALGIGGGVGMIWLLLLRFMKDSDHAYPITLSALLVVYVLIDHAGGSAALGILTVAIILGNAPSLSRAVGLAHPVELDTEVRGFHRQMVFIVKSFFFVFIGAMLGPPWSLILIGVLLGFALLIVRAPAVTLSVLGSAFDADQKKLATVALPRGMAAGVLATLPWSAHVPNTEWLPVMVFATVFTTILLFAVGFPFVRRRMRPPAEVSRAAFARADLGE
jgi:cell volume regulation protein A